MIKKACLITAMLIIILLVPGCSLVKDKTHGLPASGPTAEFTPMENEQADLAITPAEDAENDTSNAVNDSDYYIPKLELGRYSVSSDPVVIFTEHAIVRIEPNLIYPKNLGDFIEEIIKIMEQETGLSFSTDNKLIISVQFSSNPYSTERGITIQPIDVIPSNIETILHELSHTLQLQTCNIKTQMFQEGFAIMNSYRISSKFRIPNLFDPFFNYSFYDNEELMLSDPVTYFQEVRGWDAYLCGFRFAYFLEEKYGKTIYPEIFKAIKELYPYGCNNSELMDVIKSQTSDEVFDEFKEWYKGRREIFDKSHPTVNLNQTAYLEVFPLYNENFKGYSLPRFTYKDNITLDFTDGFAYLQYMGHNIKGLFGTAQSEGEHTINFYDVSGELICTQQVNNSLVRLDTYGAVKIEITGDGSLINIVPDFDLITGKQ